MKQEFLRRVNQFRKTHWTMLEIQRQSHEMDSVSGQALKMLSWYDTTQLSKDLNGRSEVTISLPKREPSQVTTEAPLSTYDNCAGSVVLGQSDHGKSVNALVGLLAADLVVTASATRNSSSAALATALNNIVAISNLGEGI